MGKILMRRVLFFGLVTSLVLVFFGILPAQEKKEFDAKKKAFCELMICHGEQAYARGQYEKAGYYFLQAVKADSAGMAKAWYKLNGAKDTGEVSQTPPAVPVQSEEPCDPEVIMGDDEGC